LAGALLVHVLVGLRPVYEHARTSDGRDFASYYYAFRVASAGGDPYDTAALERLARREHTRKRVNPFFYPPPFLLTQAFAGTLTLRQGFFCLLALNELLLAACAFMCVRWYGVAFGVMALMVALYSPFFDHAQMGQANLLVLAPLLAGLALAPKRPWLGGALVGVAAMLKMSPALMLAYFVLERRLRAVVAAGVAAVALSVATLPLVGFAAQRRFYLQVLPSFSSGEYHGLSLPIGMTSNHSIPSFWNRLWHGPDGHHLSAAASHLSTLTAVLLFALWAYRFRRSARDPDANAIGALLVLMTFIPVYTYEHHLVFLMLALGAAAMTRPGPALLGVAFFLARPLAWQRGAEHALPLFRGLLRDSKLAAGLVLFGLNLLGPRAGAPPWARRFERVRGWSNGVRARAAAVLQRKTKDQARTVTNEMTRPEPRASGASGAEAAA
jgi:alpha-1,2-mannosyltransferase